MKFDYPWIKEPLADVLTRAGAAMLPAALLIHGRAGIGKTAFALQLAQGLLCEEPVWQQRPCGRCAACQWFEAGNHPDFRLLTPGSLLADFGLGSQQDEDDSAQPKSKTAEAAARSQEIRIDQVRGLAGFFAVGAHRAGRRVVLLDPAETLNLEASNAVLKVLEEPSANLHFILVCQQPGALLPTIASRCQRLAIAAPGEEAAAQWLSASSGQSLADATKALRRSGSAPLRARQLVEPPQMAAYQLTLEAISQLPDTGPVETAGRLLDEAAQRVLDIGRHWLLDVERVRVGLSPMRFPELAARLRSLAKRTDGRRISAALQALNRQARLVRHPLNARLFLEECLIAVSQAFN